MSMRLAANSHAEPWFVRVYASPTPVAARTPRAVRWLGRMASEIRAARNRSRRRSGSASRNVISRRAVSIAASSAWGTGGRAAARTPGRAATRERERRTRATRAADSGAGAHGDRREVFADGIAGRERQRLERKERQRGHAGNGQHGERGA